MIVFMGNSNLNPTIRKKCEKDKKTSVESVEVDIATGNVTPLPIRPPAPSASVGKTAIEGWYW